MTDSRLLVVMVHPDDETFRCGGTLALLAQRGIAVQVLSATRGEAGSPDVLPEEEREKLALAREQELHCACAALGISSSRERGVIVGGNGVYLESIALTRTLPCLAEPGKIIVIGTPSRDLGDVLPFLAALPNIITYNPDAFTLTFRRPQGFLTLYRDKVIFTQVDDAAQGIELLAALVDAINATWTHRHELTAMSKPRRTPRPLDVWALLPQSNCKQCGEMTCMAFAFAVLQQQRDVDECKPLAEDEAFADRRVMLEAMLGGGA